MDYINYTFLTLMALGFYLFIERTTSFSIGRRFENNLLTENYKEVLKAQTALNQLDALADGPQSNDRPIYVDPKTMRGYRDARLS